MLWLTHLTAKPGTNKYQKNSFFTHTEISNSYDHCQKEIRLQFE